MEQKKKIDSIMEKTAERLTGLVDVNTVIGKPLFSKSGSAQGKRSNRSSPTPSRRFAKRAGACSG